MLEKLYDLGYAVCTQIIKGRIHVRVYKDRRSISVDWDLDGTFIIMDIKDDWYINPGDHKLKISRTKWIHNDINFAYEMIYRNVKGEN